MGVEEYRLPISSIAVVLPTEVIFSREGTVPGLAQAGLLEIKKGFAPLKSLGRTMVFGCVLIFAGVPLDMDKTLEQNGVADEDESFYELRMDKDDYYPTIQLYYNDDLTDA